MQISSEELWELLFPELDQMLTSGRITEEVIVQFLEVELKTLRRWRAHKQGPIGEKLIRLWQLLALAGSTAAKEYPIPAINRLLSELYAFDVLSLEEVCEYAGKKMSASSGSILRTFRGDPILHPEVSIQDLHEAYGEILLEKKIHLHNQFRLSASSEDLEEKNPVFEDSHQEEIGLTHQLKESAPLTGLLPTDLKVALAGLLSGAAPIAKHLNSDAVSAEERSEFRELIGTDVLFELSNTLNALCSERARGMVR